MTKRCGWCGHDFGLVPGTEDQTGETTTLCKTCEAIVSAQNALGLVIKLIADASSRLKWRDCETILLTKEDRDEIREAYDMVNTERERRSAVKVAAEKEG